MKISEMPTDKACDVLVDISEAVSNIACDEEIEAFLQKIQDPDTGKMNIFTFIGKHANRIIPVVFKMHREDLFLIINRLTEKTFEEISKQPLSVSILDIKQNMDGELIQLFTQAGK